MTEPDADLGADPETAPPARGIRAFIGLALAAQVALAIFMVAPDLEPWLRQGLAPQVAPSTGPIRPGDQRREFLPDRPGVEIGPPATELPQVMPPRLVFLRTEIDGTPVLLVTGEIAEGDADRFDRFLANEADVPGIIALHSPGGLVHEGLAIGRSLRAQGLTTAVYSGMQCHSTCPYVLAGGADRIVSRAGAVGVHQHYFETPGYLPAFLAVEGIQSGQARTLEYLIEMGIDPRVMIPALRTPPDQIYVLVEEELTDFGLATRMIDP